MATPCSDYSPVASRHLQGNQIKHQEASTGLEARAQLRWVRAEIGVRAALRTMPLVARSDLCCGRAWQAALRINGREYRYVR